MLIVLPTLLLQEFYHILSITQKGMALSVIKTQGVLHIKLGRFCRQNTTFSNNSKGRVPRAMPVGIYDFSIFVIVM